VCSSLFAGFGTLLKQQKQRGDNIKNSTRENVSKIKKFNQKFS